MDGDIEFVEELARMLRRSRALEIEVEVGDLYVRLKRSPERGEPGPSAAEGQEEAAAEEEAARRAERVEVRSPYVGLFKPLVSEGREVKEGEVICFVEVLGVLNEVTSPVKGRVADLPLNEGDPVEYGQVLAEIEPVSDEGDGG